MAIEQAFQELEQRLRGLREALGELVRILGEDRPQGQETALADALNGAALDLLGILDEALAAVSGPTRAAEPARALMICQERFNRLTHLFWSYLQSFERLQDLDRLGHARGGAWLVWSFTARQAIERCRQPVYEANDALFRCWQDVTGWALQTPPAGRAPDTLPLPLFTSGEARPPLAESAAHLLTGRQHSLYQHGRATLVQVLPLLDRLAPLAADADLEQFTASKAIIRTELEELVDELGLSGGPRVARADKLFERLAGPLTSRTHLRGELKNLRDYGGFGREEVDTVQEEEGLTNFRIIADYIILLRMRWNEIRRDFDRRPTELEDSDDKRLVLLMRALAVIALSVRQLDVVLDSVYLGPAERETIDLNLPAEPPLSLAELLDWVERFASNEGPRLIADAGEDARAVVAASLVDLCRFISDSLLPRKEQEQLPAGLREERVQHAVQRLLQHVRSALELARFQTGEVPTDPLPKGDC